MDAKIVLNPAFRISTIDPRVYGGFIEHLGRAVYEGIYEPGHPTSDGDGFRGDVLELVRELNMPVTRYPGGNFVSGYNWEDGVGPREKRPVRRDLAWMALEPNQFGLNEFVAWCRKAKTDPMMAINLGTRGTEEARNIVEYCNVAGGSHWSDLRRAHGCVNPHAIKLWRLGNEMDGPWQIGHKNADDYAKAACEAAKVMKWTDPSIELVACGSSNQGMPDFGTWEEKVLTACYHHVDYLSLHQYYGNPTDDTPLFLSKPDAMNDFIRTVASICDLVQAKLRGKKRVNLSFDEWNVWFHSGKKDVAQPEWTCPRAILEDQYTMEDALVVGGILITLLNNADRVKIACLAQTVNVIAPIMTAKGGPAWRQTIFHPFAQASRFGRGTVLRSVVESPTYDIKDGKASRLHSVAVLSPDEREVTVFAVNRSIDGDLDLEIDLSSFDGMKPVEWLVLNHANLKAENTQANPDEVKPAKANGLAIRKGKACVTLPKASWNVIRCATTT